MDIKILKKVLKHTEYDVFNRFSSKIFNRVTVKTVRKKNIK